ncbi:MAG: AAA family ATPase [bacterium]
MNLNVFTIGLCLIIAGIFIYFQRYFLNIGNKIGNKKINFLGQFSKDLTEMAKLGKIDPVIGRELEIERVIQILSRRTKNNPILIGEPGVGKTAVAEGLALAISKGEVPKSLKDKTVLCLDLAAIVAGTKYRGEFEKRIKDLIDEIVSAKRSIILFIDEIHMIAMDPKGNSDSSTNIANILKPALARGDLQTVGATTTKEYIQFFSQDETLARRFQSVIIEQPTVEQTIKILNGIKDKYEAHHEVRISGEIVELIANLANTIPGRALPDKAIDLLDESAANVRLNNVDAKDFIDVSKEDVLDVYNEWKNNEVFPEKDLEIL